MDNKKRTSKKAWIVIIVVLVIQILFDPFSGMSRLDNQLKVRTGLPKARSKWETQGITHYRFDVSGGIAMVCLFSGEIEVKDGVTIHRGPRSDFAKEQNYYDPGFWSSEGGYSICNPKTYTIPLLFDEVEYWLTNSQSLTGFNIPAIDVSFDPKYGFISRLNFGSCGGRGLLSPKIADCSGGFAIENFQVLDE